MSKTQTTTAKLSDTQLVILSTAAQRDDGSLLPFPQTLTAKGTALCKVVETLSSRRKLVEERQTVNGAPEWRRDEEHGPLGLFITKSGLLALGIDEKKDTKPSEAAASMPRQRKTAAAKPAAQQRSEGFSRQTQGTNSALTEKAGSRDSDASASVRRHDRGRYD